MPIKDGKLLYHLTTLDVLESIIEFGLLSREELNKRQIKFVDTANHEILSGRDRLRLSNEEFGFIENTLLGYSIK